MNLVFAVSFFFVALVSDFALGGANPPVKINDIVFDQKKSSQQVLLYYANETAPDEKELANFNVIKSWLKESNTHIGQKQIHRYDVELEKFVAVVDKEILQLKKLLNSIPQPDRPSMVIVTNRLARLKKLEVYVTDIAEWYEANLDFPVSENYIENSNPLVTVSAMRSVLSKVAEIFDTKEKQFIFHIKSHGTQNLALTTMLGRRHEELSKEEVIASIRKAQADLDQGTPTNVVAESNIGILKENFFALIQEAGANLGIVIPILYLEACKSGLKLDQIGSMPSNIGIILSSDHEGIEYSNIDYEKFDWQISSIAVNYIEQLSKISEVVLQSKYNFNIATFFGKPSNYESKSLFWWLIGAGCLFLIVPLRKKSRTE